MNFLFLSLLALLRLTPAAPAVAPDPYAGTWLDSADSRVEITRQGNTYVSRYVGFKDVTASRKKGFEVGAVFMKDLKADGSDLSGKVIDWETKKEYKATLTATDANHLVMKVKVMGITAHTENWTRVAVPATN